MNVSSAAAAAACRDNDETVKSAHANALWTEIPDITPLGLMAYGDYQCVGI
jgi:hypothetical protein